MIERILMVARRDLVATLTAKGFIIGLVVGPVLILVLVVIVPRLMSFNSPPIRGEVAVIDRSGSVLPEVRTALDPAAVSSRRDKTLGQTGGQGPAALFGAVPVLSTSERPSSADVQAEKSWLIGPAAAAAHHLALVVVPADAVTLAPGKQAYGAYELYVAKGSSTAVEMTIQGAMREALVSARLKAKGIDRADFDRTLTVAQPNAIVVVAAGEQSVPPGPLRMLLPYISGLLLFMGVMMGGQALMTSTIEEKSNRVVEVLLAAVAPLELMWGKLLAQLAVGLLVVCVYASLGLMALAQFAISGAIEPMLLVDLVVLFIVAYLSYGTLMMTVGAAVNSIADAQSLLMPVMMLLVIPYAMTAFIGQAPSSPLSVTLSFVPPVNTFVMLARLASDSPPPTWQVGLTVLLGLAFAALVLWFAAKVFRIGLLIHGKPPSFGTLVRWARMA